MNTYKVTTDFIEMIIKTSLPYPEIEAKINKQFPFARIVLLLD